MSSVRLRTVWERFLEHEISIGGGGIRVGFGRIRGNRSDLVDRIGCNRKAFIQPPLGFNGLWQFSREGP